MATLVGDVDARFQGLLERGADPASVAALLTVVRACNDDALVRINPYTFARERQLESDAVVNTFLIAARAGLFEMSWNMVCPGCGGILGAHGSLRSVKHESYSCFLCSMAFEPSLDERIEVTFTVSPTVASIDAHHPDTLDPSSYLRHFYFARTLGLPPRAAWDAMFARTMLEHEVVPPRGRVILSVVLPEEPLFIFDPVTHGTCVLTVAGEPRRERQEIVLQFTDTGVTPRTLALRPGPVRLVLENHTDDRVIALVERMTSEFREFMGARQPTLTAKQVLSNHVFRTLFKTGEEMSVDQRLKLTNLTVLFTDLKGSTELYERVGDLTAYDLVRAHFEVLSRTVARHGGAVVKTIGDAVMATFPTPERGFAAALAMRDGMRTFNDSRDHEDLIVKIGLHEGPCLAVVLNERLDYFGQTVNIAARVQGLAGDQSILTTEPVVRHPAVAAFITEHGLEPRASQAALKGIKEALTVYEVQ